MLPLPAEPEAPPDALVGTVKLCQALSDPTRLRLLAVLADAPLTVAELTEVLALPQPRVSSHLQRLREAGLAVAWRQGASSLYQLQAPADGAGAALVGAALGGAAGPQLEADRALARLLIARRTGGDALGRRYLPGRSWEALARGLVRLTDLGEVVDLGSGDAGVACLLAPAARRITCVERDPQALAAARARGGLPPQLCLLEADLYAVPLPSGAADLVLLLGVLPMLSAPDRALSEARRLLRPGGALWLSTLDRHAHPEVAAGYGHTNPGQSPAELLALLRSAGFVDAQIEPAAREARPPHFEILNAVARTPLHPLESP